MIVAIALTSCTGIYFDRKQPDGSPDIKVPKEMDGIYVSDSGFVYDKADTLIIKNGLIEKSSVIEKQNRLVLRRLSTNKLVFNIAKSAQASQYWLCVLIEHDRTYNKLEVFGLLNHSERMEKLFQQVDTFGIQNEDSRDIVLKAGNSQFLEIIKDGYFEKLTTYRKIKK